jgi:cytochrome oxidase assembly protein ShyY1
MTGAGTRAGRSGGPGAEPSPVRLRPADGPADGEGTGRLEAATVRSAIALLREPLWRRLVVAVVLLSVAFFFLGRWQLGRHETRVARNRLINAGYTAAPVAVTDVLPSPGSTLSPAREWAQVRLTGAYEPDRQVLVRNRPLDGAFGYEVIVPLRLPSGAALLVDRGWLPPGEDFVRPATVPPPPSGQVTAVVRVRPGEPPLDRAPPPGQELRIDLARLAAVAGGTVYRGAYGVLASESPAPAAAPAPLPRPDEDLGPHLAYAVQWWIGDVAAYVLLGYYALAEARQRRRPQLTGPGTPASPDGSGACPGEPSGVTGPPGARDPRPRRRFGLPPGRRGGPTDEEWEDAVTDELS